MKQLKDLTEIEYYKLGLIGMLHEFYPEATGSYKKDCLPKSFIEEQLDVFRRIGERGKGRIEEKLDKSSSLTPTEEEALETFIHLIDEVNRTKKEIIK